MSCNGSQNTEDDRVVVWFDIDNTLYSASARISHVMGERIHGSFPSREPNIPSDPPPAYFVSLGLSHEDGSELHHQYYTQYGLALRGLIRHYDVGNTVSRLSVLLHTSKRLTLDPLDFDRQCDGSLPLEEMIKSDPKLVKLFEDIDRTKARVWALTNAYKPVSLTSIIWRSSHFSARPTCSTYSSTRASC